MSTAAQTHTIWFCLISDGSLPHRDWCDDWGKLDLRLGDNHPRRCGPRREMNATGSGSKPHTPWLADVHQRTSHHNLRGGPPNLVPYADER